jgi:sialate O-acetylesterase
MADACVVKFILVVNLFGNKIRGVVINNYGHLNINRYKQNVYFCLDRFCSSKFTSIIELKFINVKKEMALNIMKKVILFLLIIHSTVSWGQLKLARLFTDNMVLQRQKPINVWGWASANQLVKASLNGETKSTTVNNNGKWQITFGSIETSEPFQMVVNAGSQTVTVNNIVVGEVYLCSGQSNMAWTVKQSDNFKNELKNANYPNIRVFEVERTVSLTPQEDLQKGDWKSSTPQSVGNFPAVAYFMARELHQKLNVPIGLINASWGGTQIENWLSKEGMESSTEFKEVVKNIPNSWDIVHKNIEKGLLKRFLNSENPPTLEDERKYTQENYDFGSWQNIGLPVIKWDNRGLMSFRGNGYMACTFEVPAHLLSANTSLSLAIQDSNNEIYLNGKLIHSGILKGVRKINIPENTLKVGKNAVMMKMGSMVKDSNYGMGLAGNNDDVYFESNNEKTLLDENWKIMPSFAEPHNYLKIPNMAVTGLYNSMIAPLIPYTFRGVLWYQGEANAAKAYQYRTTFPLMINDWRKKWNANFSFTYVQLATFGEFNNSNTGSSWAELREAQTMALSLPNTGMVVTTDLGNPANIHPTNKQEVGHRLFLSVLKTDFKQDVVHAGPMFNKMEIEADKAIISFTQMGTGLTVKDNYDYLKGFEVAGEDKKFYFAKAELNQDKVIVFHPKVTKIASVRYAWSNSPVEANLYNKEGLPAISFRTDNWDGITKNSK